MSVFYLLRIKSLELEIDGEYADRCLQVLWFEDMTHNSRTCPWEDYSDERVAVFLGGLKEHAIEIVSTEAYLGDWLRVRAELVEVKGCYDSFKAGMELAEREALPGDDRPTVSSRLLPKDFVPAVLKTKYKPLRFATEKEFTAFFAQRVKEKEGSGDPRKKKKIESV